MPYVQVLNQEQNQESLTEESLTEDLMSALDLLFPEEANMKESIQEYWLKWKENPSLVLSENKHSEPDSAVSEPILEFRKNVAVGGVKKQTEINDEDDLAPSDERRWWGNYHAQNASSENKKQICPRLSNNDVEKTIFIDLTTMQEHNSSIGSELDSWGAPLLKTEHTQSDQQLATTSPNLRTRIEMQEEKLKQTRKDINELKAFINECKNNQFKKRDESSSPANSGSNNADYDSPPSQGFFPS